MSNAQVVAIIGSVGSRFGLIQTKMGIDMAFELKRE